MTVFSLLYKESSFKKREGGGDKIERPSKDKKKKKKEKNKN